MAAGPKGCATTSVLARLPFVQLNVAAGRPAAVATPLLVATVGEAANTQGAVVKVPLAALARHLGNQLPPTLLPPASSP